MVGLLLALGSLLYLIGWLWMIVVAFQTGQDTSDKIIWALVCFFCGILGGIIFFIVKKQGRTPLMIEGVGFLLSIVAVILGGGQASFNIGG